MKFQQTLPFCKQKANLSPLNRLFESKYNYQPPKKISFYFQQI